MLTIIIITEPEIWIYAWSKLMAEHNQFCVVIFKLCDATYMDANQQAVKLARLSTTLPHWIVSAPVKPNRWSWYYTMYTHVEVLKSTQMCSGSPCHDPEAAWGLQQLIPCLGMMTGEALIWWDTFMNDVPMLFQTLISFVVKASTCKTAIQLMWQRSHNKVNH